MNKRDIVKFLVYWRVVIALLIAEVFVVWFIVDRFASGHVYGFVFIAMAVVHWIPFLVMDALDNLGVLHDDSDGIRKLQVLLLFYIVQCLIVYFPLVFIGNLVLRNSSRNPKDKTDK